MDTNISKVIDITSDSAKYDASIKEMLADKQILSRILKYTLDEFSQMDIEDIMKSMDEPQISSARMEPGVTNTEKIQKVSEEDNVLGEGKIYYDIRFNAYLEKEQIKILVKIEAQKSTNPSKLGYHLDNRIIISWENDICTKRSRIYEILIRRFKSCKEYLDMHGFSRSGRLYQYD